MWLLIPMLVACGGAANAPQGPTAAGVSTQQGDVPRGMVKCDLSGDIVTFIHQEQASDQSAGEQALSEWRDLQKSGAKDAYVAVYSESNGQCAELKSPGSNPTVTMHKLVIDFTVQFKDEKTAIATYTNGTIFGASASDLRANAVNSLSQSQAVEGTKTGLTANSIVVNQSIPPQTFYVALWQDASFVVYLTAINLDPQAGQKLAVAQNKRVK